MKIQLPVEEEKSHQKKKSQMKLREYLQCLKELNSSSKIKMMVMELSLSSPIQGPTWNGTTCLHYGGHSGLRSKEEYIHFANCLFYDEIYFQGVLCLHGLPRSHERLRSSGRVTRFSEFFQPESGHFELRSTFPSPSLPW